MCLWSDSENLPLPEHRENSDKKSGPLKWDRIHKKQNGWRTSTKNQNLSSLVCSIVGILTGDFKQFKYGKVILPLVILRQVYSFDFYFRA